MDYNEKDGRLERLEKEIRQYMSGSKDYYFTEYLQKLSQRVIHQKYQVDLLQDELDRNYKLYRQRAQLDIARESEAPQTPSTVCETPSPVCETPPVGETPSPACETPPPQNQPRTIYTAIPVWNFSSQGTAQQGANQPAEVWQFKEPKISGAKGGEFAIGAVLLSILGGAFILTALVLFGINYMNGFVRGMGLYAIATLVLVVSEVFIYRRWRMLGSTLSAIGMGGLYLSTVVNYLSLGNFPGWTAMIITAVIMLFVVLMSRKRDSAMYRIIGLTACYLCLFPIQRDMGEGAFVSAVAMIFLVNLACTLLPIKKHDTVMNIVHMSANTVFAQIFLWRAIYYDIAEGPRMLFFMSSLVILQVLFVLQIRRHKENTVGIQVAYGISSLVYLFMFYFELDSILLYETEPSIFPAVSLLGIFVISVFAFLLLWKHKEKWFVLTFFNLVIVAVASLFGIQSEHILYLALLIAVKLFTVKKPAVLLKINDAVLTFLICMEVIYYAMKSSLSSAELFCAGLMLAGVLISILFISFWQNYYKLLLTYTVAFFLVCTVPPMLKLPIFVGVMFVGLLLFNNMKRWHGKNRIVFNGLALSGQIVCFLVLIHPVYRNSYLTYLFMLVFGLATIVLTFQEKYQMNFRCKSMITVCFLTYMALIVKLNFPVINSILMMLIALASVGMGFVEKKKNIRIYGLVLSLLICGKIVLYDFMSAPTLQKTILFFVVGVIALVISGMYIVLEKKNDTK